MEAGTVAPELAEQNGAPAEGGAEATRSSAHLFQYSAHIHAGEGAEECEHREDGKCRDEGHFHAWVCMPNTLQHHDIEEKATAARARRKRAMREEGDGEKPPGDAFVMLEAELDDLMEGEREPVLEGLADRAQRDRFTDLVREVTEEERFEHYQQDAEEYRRQEALPEEQRAEDYPDLDARMSEFGEAVEAHLTVDRTRELESLRVLPDADIREKLRQSRIEGAARAAYTHVYYQWMMFVCTRKFAARLAPRYFGSLQEMRDAAPEVLQALDDTVRDLELRFLRGDAAGN